MHLKSLLIQATLILLTLTGCGTTASHIVNSSNSMGNMSGMTMTSTSSNSSLAQVFQDELNGFSTLQMDVSKGDYKDAESLASKLHDEFHAAILPPLESVKGKTYAEEIHSKYDALQDAVASRNLSNISALLKTNTKNLKKVAGILNIQLGR